MILLYCGREHHAKKLMPIRDELERRGLNPVWFTAKNAINLDSSLEVAIKARGNYIHSYVDLDEATFKEAEDVAQAINKKMPLVPGVVPFWQYYSTREMAQVYFSFKKIMQHEEAQAVIALHSNNFWAKTMLYLAEQLGLPAYSFQEGLLRDRDQETLGKQTSAGDYSPHLFVWNSESRIQYMEAGVSKQNMTISGPMHLDKYVNAEPKPLERPVLVFCPTLQEEYVGSVKIDATNMRNLAQGLGMSFVFNPHPFEKGQYPGLETPAQDLLLLARTGMSLFVGQHSTIMHEALALGAVVLEYQADGKEILQPLSKKGVALKANGNTVVDEVTKLLDGKYVLVNKVDNYLRREYKGTLGKSTKIVADRIQKDLMNGK